MKLVISKGEHASIWEVTDKDQATRIHFPNYEEHELLQPIDVRSISLPTEIVDQILNYVFQIYLENFNFDLCQDLLLYSRSFTRFLYRQIYGPNKSSFSIIYHRLLNSFYILEAIYDYYLAEPATELQTCIKLTSVKPPGGRHRPWHFTHKPVIGVIEGLVIDLTENYEHVLTGPCYGNYVYLQGRHRNGLFFTGKLRTPVLNLVMVDVFDTLIHDLTGVHASFLGFFNLLKRAFGPNTGVFLMLQKLEEQNPFITQSDLFFEF